MGGFGSGRKTLKQEVNKLAIITKAWNITSKVLDTLDEKERIQIAKEIVLKDMQRLVPTVDARQINIHLGSADVAQLKQVVKQLKELNTFSDDNTVDKAITNGIEGLIETTSTPIQEPIVEPCPSQGHLKGIVDVVDNDKGNGIEDGKKVGCGEGGGTLLSHNVSPNFPLLLNNDSQNETQDRT